VNLLLVGEDRDGALLRSFEYALQGKCAVTVVDPMAGATASLDHSSLAAKLRRRLVARSVPARFLEAVEQFTPDVTLVVKGRGIDDRSIAAARRHTRAVIYYPDNPFWGFGDTAGALGRLSAADTVLIWSHRLRDRLLSTCARVETLAFGYDSRWFPLTAPDTPRSGVAFVGTWSLKRERYLEALRGLDLTVIGSGWSGSPIGGARAATYGTSAGAILRSAALGVNLLHPHNAGAHNMRTREIASCGALQLTDPGIDGTPLRDSDGCRWIRSPEHLRELADWYLERPEEARAIARRGQELIADDSYDRRGTEMLRILESVG
jgi:glycosyl transferase family 1